MHLQTILSDIGKVYHLRVIAFHVGAGISHDPPSNLPLGNDLANAITSGFFESLDSPDSELLRRAIRRCSLEEVCGLIQRELFEPEKLIDAMADALDHDGLVPNQNHLFLAQALHNGHIVVTTNYDSQIERAYRCLYNEDFSTSHICYNDATFKPFSVDTGALGWLLKLHGSFRVGTDITTDSVMTTLQRVGKGLTQNAENSLRNVLRNCPVVVLGYGGLDIDIVYPILVDTESTETMWWVKHGAEKTVKPYDMLQDEIADTERKLLTGEPVDIGTTNVLRLLRRRASKAPDKSWLIRDDTSQVIDGLFSRIGRDLGTDAKVSVVAPDYWEDRLHEFGRRCNDIEKLLVLGKLAQVSAIRRIPNTGESLPDASTMYDLSDKLLNIALDRVEDPLKARIYQELGWNQYRRNPEANARSTIECYEKARALLPSKDPDPFMLGLVSLTHLRSRQISEALTTAQAAWNALPVMIRQLTTVDPETILTEPTIPQIGSFDYVGTSSILRRIAAAFNGYVSGPVTLSTAIGFAQAWHMDDKERKLLEQARQLAEVARVLSLKAGERREQIQAENFLGLICSKLEDGTAATKAHDASRHTAEQFGWYPELPQALRNLGLARETDDKLSDAITTLEVAQRLFSEAGRKEDVLTTLWHIGRIKTKAGQAEGADDIRAHLEGIKGTRLDTWHWRANDQALLGIASWDVLASRSVGMNHFVSMLKEYQSGNGTVDFRAQGYGVDNALANVISALYRIRSDRVDEHASLAAQLSSLRSYLEELRAALLGDIPNI